jgi:hypothetical protein
MKQQILGMTYEIDLKPDEKSDSSSNLIRVHQAFLNSYVPEDEGLYDDCPPG